MPSLHRTKSNIFWGIGLSPALLLISLVLAATLLIACSPFGSSRIQFPGDADNAANKEPTEALTEVPPEVVSPALAPALAPELAPELAEVGLERIQAASDEPDAAKNDEMPAAKPDPSPTPTNTLVPADTSMGTADEARNQVWAYLAQCVSLAADQLEARQIQGEWFVQAAGELPDQFGLWKVEPISGLVQAHNIRARQWDPLVNQNCTPEQFNEFFAPTPSALGIADVTEADQAVTTLWATLVICYPNMAIADLQATLNPAIGEWVVTARTDISANYGVWAVASDGTVSPKNRQAQGVFEQLDSGLC